MTCLSTLDILDRPCLLKDERKYFGCYDIEYSCFGSKHFNLFISLLKVIFSLLFILILLLLLSLDLLQVPLSLILERRVFPI